VEQATPVQIEYGQLRDKYAGPVLGGGQKAKQEKARRMVEDLRKFIDKYPETEEALDAMGLMGINYQAPLILNEPEKAIEIYLRMRAVATKMGKPDKEQAAVSMLAYTYRELRQDDRELKVQRDLLGLMGDAEARKPIEARIYALENLQVGKPPIPLPPHVVDLDGNPMSLKACLGKTVLLDFWSSEVKECLIDLDFKKDAYARFHDRGFEILGISMDMERPALKNLLEDYKIAWPQYFNKKSPGWNNDVLHLYTIGRLPATFLIDRQGILRYKDPSGRDLPMLVEKLLGE
jgi:peroxiredoxin